MVSTMTAARYRAIAAKENEKYSRGVYSRWLKELGLREITEALADNKTGSGILVKLISEDLRETDISLRPSLALNQNLSRSFSRRSFTPSNMNRSR